MTRDADSVSRTTLLSQAVGKPTAFPAVLSSSEGDRVLESEALQRLVRFPHETDRPLSVPPGDFAETHATPGGPVDFSANAYLRPSACLRRPHAAEVLA
jgi:hypothetical protein